MPLAKSDCLDTFLRAWAALEEIVVSSKSSDDQVSAAEATQDQLTHDFIRERLDSLSERNAAFTEFIRMMGDVVNTIGTQGPLAAIKRLRGVLDDATSLVKSAGDALAPTKAGNDEA